MDTYQCAMCGEVFVKGQTDEEAETEMKAAFGQSVESADCDVVCDDCWQQIDPAHYPELAEQAADETLRSRLIE